MDNTAMNKVFCTEATEKKEVRTLKKLELGTFCRVDSIKKGAEGRLYALEDAYGNIKEFNEEQVVAQMQLGTLNIINLELNENNKLIRKTPEALEVTESNIGSLGCFPMLVKVFDLTTEKEGTAVALGFNKQDGWRSILNVVINGNMYEASMRSTLNRNIECKKSSCITCKERHTDKCRYNRYGGGYKLCIEIGVERNQRAAYVPKKNNNELLAVAMENGNIKAWLEKDWNEKRWKGFGRYDDFSEEEFSNVARWGGVLQFNVPMIDWATFNQKRENRLEFLESEIKEMAWCAVKTGYLELNYSESRISMSFEDKETSTYWYELEDEYKELGGSFSDIFDTVVSYIKEKASEEDMRMWTLQFYDEINFYAADPKESVRGKCCIEKLYLDWKYELVECSEYPEEAAEDLLQTNIWDKVEVEEE